MKVVFKGEKGSLRGLASDLQIAGRRVGSSAAKVIRDGTRRVQRDAVAAAPVDDGELRGSIDARLFGDGRSGSVTGVVGASARHAIFQEFGTSRHGPQPFLFPALERHQDTVMRDLAALIDDVL